MFKFVQEHFLFIHLNNCVHEWLTHVAKPTIINPLPRALSQSPTRCSSLPPPLPTYALPSLFPHINLPLSPYSISITGFPSRLLLLDNDGSSSRDFDLTSLRLDVKTDGRHAEVEFALIGHSTPRGGKESNQSRCANAVE